MGTQRKWGRLATDNRNKNLKQPGINRIGRAQNLYKDKTSACLKDVSKPSEETLPVASGWERACWCRPSSPKKNVLFSAACKELSKMALTFIMTRYNKIFFKR